MAVRPGALRAARIKAGLSLAEVAGPELTRAAIHAVETGKARPSMPTLELIAQRTGLPVSHFLLRLELGSPTVTDPRIQELARLCLCGDFANVVDLATAALTVAMPREARAQVRYYLGRAHVSLSRPDQALEQLREARKVFEGLGDPWMAVECMDWEAGALRLKEDRSALLLEAEALRRCRQLEPRIPQTEARILEHIATLHLGRHEWEPAIFHYELALEAAGSVRDLGRLARTYHGLATAHYQTGDLERGAEFMYKALALYEAQNDQTSLATGESALGFLLMRQGRWERAEELFAGAISRFEELGQERLKPATLIGLCEVRLHQGQLEQALRLGRETASLAESMEEPITLADAHQLLGRIQAALGQPELADQEFRAAFSLLTEASLDQRLAECHATYARILEQRGDALAALWNWKRAALLALPEGGRASLSIAQ